MINRRYRFWKAQTRGHPEPRRRCRPSHFIWASSRAIVRGRVWNRSRSSAIFLL